MPMSGFRPSARRPDRHAIYRAVVDDGRTRSPIAKVRLQDYSSHC